MKQTNIFKISLGVLILFHAIGVLIFTYYPSGVSLSYLTLLLCGIALFISEKNKLKASIAYISIFALSFLIEYIGVHTNYLFGTYTYGNSLGYKLDEIPIIIGINWIAIVVSSVSLVKTFKITSNKLLIVGMSALLCTGMDYIIEPVAVVSDYWSWQKDIIPVSNYIDWYIFSFIFAYIYVSLKLPVNKIAVYLFFIWIVFFSLIKFMA